MEINKPIDLTPGVLWIVNDEDHLRKHGYELKKRYDGLHWWSMFIGMTVVLLVHTYTSG